MGEIRSALDIALEKTADIPSDKTSASNRESKNLGKKTANNFIATGDVGVLKKLTAETKKEQYEAVIDGAISIFVASLRLPSSEDDLTNLSTIGIGLETLIPNSGLKKLLSQVDQIFRQYLTEREQLEKALEQQFMPRLRAKQQELAKRYGQNIPINPSQDPEYMSALTKNQHMLEEKYESVITEVRTRIKEAAGVEE